MSTRKTSIEKIRQEKLATLLEQFLSADPSETESNEAQGKALEQFVLESLRIQQGADESPLRRKTQIDAATTAKAATWDTDFPEFVAIQKILNRAFTGRHADAAMYAERNDKNEHKKVTSTKSAYGRANADKKHALKKNAKDQGVADYVSNRKNYSKLKKTAAIELAEKFPLLASSTFKKAIQGR